MAASNANMTAVGASGRRYNVEVYVPDAISTQLTFNPNGLAAATSATDWTAPERCVITDISILAAPTAVGFTWTANGATINGATCRWNNQLETLTNRLAQAVPIEKGTRVGGLQF